ncbi:MAG: hypothetical protein IZT58_12330 [Actinobacteria bacterium]|nr:hypothetical protein [Actinomycetota bacterium]
MDAKVESLTIAGDPELWRSLGLTVLDDGTIPLFGTSLRIMPPASGTQGSDNPETGIVSWALSGISAPAPSENAALLIDGLPTEVVEARAPVFASHEMAASALDHVVVLTPDLERTSAAIAEATGCELKRIREVGSMRQGFHRIGRGGLIVELVERPDISEGDADFWGLVFIVDDLDQAYAQLGPERISAPKDAVQPGRQIATFRGDVGLGLPVALMSR